MSKWVLAVVNDGADPPGHSTVIGHVTLPLVTVSSSVKLYERDTGTLSKVNVLAPLIVFVK
jgi:hypothetical protein